MNLRNLFVILLIAGFVYNVIDIRSNLVSHHATRMMQIEIALAE